MMLVMVDNRYELAMVQLGLGRRAHGYKGVGLIGGSNGALDRIYETQD